VKFIQPTKPQKTTTQACDCLAVHKDSVNRVRSKLPNNSFFTRNAEMHKLFADETRLKILWMLRQENMCVCDLAVLLNMTKSAVSHQLKHLRLSGIVKCNKRGKIALYSLTDSINNKCLGECLC
jgi:ArsR family transcriptional regulator